MGMTGTVQIRKYRNNITAKIATSLHMYTTAHTCNHSGEYNTPTSINIIITTQLVFKKCSSLVHKLFLQLN